jgi:hypothetical protein
LPYPIISTKKKEQRPKKIPARTTSRRREWLKWGTIAIEVWKWVTPKNEAT